MPPEKKGAGCESPERQFKNGMIKAPSGPRALWVLNPLGVREKKKAKK